MVSFLCLRFLSETVDQLKAEKDLANSMGRRYKSASEKAKLEVAKRGGSSTVI
jgi:hypothetical protein